MQAAAVAETPPPVEATPAEPEKRNPLDRFTLKSRPGYGGELHVLPDGSMARKEDHGNDVGMFAQFIPPEGKDRPEPDVTEPLKEHRGGHTNFGYAQKDAPPKAWKKRLTGPGLIPAEERVDGDDRFGKGVEARKRHAGGQSEDGHAR
ncbi:MAG: hypothetical protein C0501_21310 [Isosphaera sp.]|nr:hypothetical protein [Isosphaera sp.]